MKKILLSLLTVILLGALTVIGVFAAETVIYENDFSDPSTLDDFEQYIQEWEIKDGGLYITGNFLPKAKNKNIDTAFPYLIYDGGEDLKDYIVEVDYMNVQTAGGIIFRSNPDACVQEDSGFAGYLAFISNDATKGALGSADDDDRYVGNINVGASGNFSLSSNVHIKVTVKGDKMNVLMTNLENGKKVYDYTYTVGTSQNDFKRTGGTFGLRMRSGYKNNMAYSAGNAYFDNLRVTTANEATIGGSAPVTTPAVNSTESIDTSNLVKVYENTFDTADSINDFYQVGGTWGVRDGKLYLTGKGALSHSFILYGGDPDLVKLTDYVVDADIYNVQTQGGILIRSDYANVIETSDSGFMGYHMFTSNNGTLGAIGAGKPDGKWLDGNIKVSSAIIQPGMDIHMQAAVKGDRIQITISDLATGKLLWRWCQRHDLWQAGTFGFRMRATESSGLSNLNAVGIDNLVVSKYAEPVQKTEVKLTIGSTTAYVNGQAKTLDVAPVIENSRTLMPLRFIAEAMGATVEWDGATSTATLTEGETKVVITLGSTTAYVNGTAKTLDAPAESRNGRTLLPVRFIAESFGAQVAWDGSTSTATLTK